MQISKTSLKNNAELSFITDFLKAHTQRVFLVGGSVRDLLLGLEIDDYDIEIYDLSVLEFENLMQKLGAKGFGKSFFVYKFKNYDLALARKENKISQGHRGFEIQPCENEKEGAKRRDFTFNALMLNLFNFELLDFYGGIKDLENKTLRHIHEKSFKEDSLRVLRALYFVAKFNFDISDETLNLMKTMDISDLSLHRINAEFYKLFKGEYLLKAYKYLQKLNLEQKIFGQNFKDEKFPFLLENARKFVKDEGLFLYLYLNHFKINKKLFFEKTQFKKSFLRAVNQAYFEEDISDFDLAKISMQMPLKSWLGLWNEERIERAKKLKLYENKFQSKISSKKLIEQGFKGKNLGLELKRLKEEELKAYLKGLV
ncbi:CCA tRNA nucleotidyltransferase [Campylobacter cuniculorum]|uniref:CCA tRNA nucleotidyltransferase n=1 Tax=Campylobacter cuniculorum TaxID=374106 RepID=UPI0023F0906A|nr:CCA tRNA nucleotidyltransferase [Campylobacter cuniculorum]